MPIIVRIIDGIPLSVILKRWLDKLGLARPIELWSREGWYCPICAAAVKVLAHNWREKQTCPDCNLPFWCAIIEGDTLATSTDDPRQRAGGA